MPEPKNLTEEEAIKVLNQILGKKSTTTEATGACIYNAGGKTYCAQLSKANCADLSGIWTEGGKCP
jgi:hypothetical protein